VLIEYRKRVIIKKSVHRLDRRNYDLVMLYLVRKRFSKLQHIKMVKR